MKKDEIWYINNRKAQHNCAIEVINKSKELREKYKNGSIAVIVRAPVKSGKKDIEVCCSFLASTAKHIHLSNFQRKDCSEQAKELGQYFGAENIFVGDEIKDIDIDKLCKDKNQTIYIHLDESDYGTGSKQRLSKKYYNLQKQNNVCFVLYSATPEETEYSDIVSGQGGRVIYTPHHTYRGADWFIKEELVFEAEPFFEKDCSLAQQGIDIITDFLNQDVKNFLVVRVTGKKPINYSTLKTNVNTPGSKIDNSIKAITDAYKKRTGNNAELLWNFVDGEDIFYWGKDYRVSGSWHDLTKRMINSKINDKCIIIMNQTCTRSTEVGFHPLIYAWHDYRSDKVKHGTARQAFERVCHYKYNGYKAMTLSGHEVLEDTKLFTDSFIKGSSPDGESRIKVYADISMFDNTSDRKIARVDTKDKYISADTGDICEKFSVKILNTQEECESHLIQLNIMNNTELKSGYTNIYDNDTYDIAKDLLEKGDTGSGKENDRRYRFINVGTVGNKNHQSSFDKLKIERPEWIGKYLFISKNEKVIIKSEHITTDKSMYGTNSDNGKYTPRFFKTEDEAKNCVIEFYGEEAKKSNNILSSNTAKQNKWVSQDKARDIVNGTYRNRGSMNNTNRKDGAQVEQILYLNGLPEQDKFDNLEIYNDYVKSNQELKHKYPECEDKKYVVMVENKNLLKCHKTNSMSMYGHKKI